jgi:hypothetical protein
LVSQVMQNSCGIIGPTRGRECQLLGMKPTGEVQVIFLELYPPLIRTDSLLKTPPPLNKEKISVLVQIDELLCYVCRQSS